MVRKERPARTRRCHDSSAVRTGVEHADGMSRRCCIDDVDRIIVLLGQLTDAHPRHQLIDAGERKLEETAQFIAIEIRSAIADFEETGEVVLEKFCVELLRVQFLDLEVCSLRFAVCGQEIREVRGWICSEEDDLTAFRKM